MYVISSWLSIYKSDFSQVELEHQGMNSDLEPTGYHNL